MAAGRIGSAGFAVADREGTQVVSGGGGYHEDRHDIGRGGRNCDGGSFFAAGIVSPSKTMGSLSV